VPVYQCDDDGSIKNPSGITKFISDSKLESVLLISNHSKPAVTEALRYSIEKTGLSGLAASYLDIRLVEGGRGADEIEVRSEIVQTNMARLQHAGLVKHAVMKTVLGSGKFSRRELLRSVRKVLKVESDVPVIMEGQCGVRSTSCSYCRDACLVNAISVAPDNVVVNDRLCIECGACARECPMGALQVPSVSDEQIMAMMSQLSGQKVEQDRPVLLLTCPMGLDKLANEVGESRAFPSDIVSAPITCVAVIGGVHYLWAVSLGVSVLTICPDISCKKAEAAVRLYRHVASSKNLIRASTDNGSASLNHLTLTSQESMLDCISRTVGSNSATIPVAELTGASRRELFLDAVRRLRAGNEKVKLPQDHTLPLFDVQVDAVKCTYCELCQKNCPDNAIEFTKNEGSASIMFDPSLCGGCMICERNCPQQAIHVTRLIELAPVLEKERLEKASDLIVKCERCGAVLGTSGSLAILKQKLFEQGASDAMLKALSLCSRCKHQTVFRPLETQPIPMNDRGT
jgi:ferredoxin